MKLHELIDLFFPQPLKRQPHIVLQEYLQGVYRYSDYPTMAKIFAEKAKEYTQKYNLNIIEQDKKILEKYK